MYIETLIETLAIFGKNLDKWDHGIILSFYTQTTKGVGFTEKQTNLAIIMLKKYASQLSVLCKKDIAPSIDYPTYKYSIRKLNLEKKISIVPYLNFSKAIKLEFPFNEKLINHIKENRSKLPNVFWDANQKSWFFELNEKNILYVVELTKLEQFDIDQEFKNYADQIEDIITNLENYVPMLTLFNKKFEYKNAHPDVPPIVSNDILSATFEARKRGIFTWDDEISNFIESEKVNSVTRLFLKSTTDYTLRISDNNGSMDCLKDIVLKLDENFNILPRSGPSRVPILNRLVLGLKNHRNKRHEI